MTDRPPSAAEAIYGHLKSQERPAQRPSNKSIADAMYPAHVPKPKPPADPYDRFMAAMGFTRTDKRGR
jgi:hypothetical protein